MLVLDDGCDCLLRITPAGDISIEVPSADIFSVTGETSANFGDSGLAIDDQGVVFFTEQQSDSVLRWDGTSISAVVTEADILAATGGTSSDPEGLAVGSDGMVYVNERNANSILQVDPTADSVNVYVDESDFTALPGITSVDFEAPIIGAEGGVIYVFSSADPDALFRLDAPGTPVLVTETDPPLVDPENHMTRAPNGDLITGDDSSPDQYYRVTPTGDISVLLDEPFLDACASSTVDTSAGIAFDGSGNFFWIDNDTNTIFVVDGSTLNDPTPDCQVFASAADIQSVTGTGPGLSGGIAFEIGATSSEARSIPTMGFWGMVLLGALLPAIGWARKRRQLG